MLLNNQWKSKLANPIPHAHSRKALGLHCQGQSLKNNSNLVPAQPIKYQPIKACWESSSIRSRPLFSKIEE